jgi:hypothetical protein
MRGSGAAASKRLQRFIRQVDPGQALWRLFSEQAEFVMGDVTEIERPQASKTEYVGTPERWQNTGVLGAEARHPLPGARHTLWSHHLLLENPCRQAGFTQSEPPACLGRDEGVSGGTPPGIGSRVP